MRNKQTNSKYYFHCILLFKLKGERDWDVETNEREVVRNSKGNVGDM